MSATAATDISFAGVRFQYPNASGDSLSDVTLSVPRGHVVGVVGLHGSGKSTLMRLMSAVLQPSSGTITVAGTSLQTSEFAWWQPSAQSGTTQVFLRPHESFSEAIRIGQADEPLNAARFADALERSRAHQVLAALPAGSETLLTTVGQLGASGLSGGQWQRIALARTSYSARPRLVILDEPTAALDPIAERAVFLRQIELARERAAQFGTITFLVSHRYITVRNADLILVVSGGRIIEQGSHQTLLALGGEYARHYRLQEQQYA